MSTWDREPETGPATVSLESVEPAACVEPADLAGLDQLPLAEHPPVFERIHGELQRALAEIDGA